MVLSKSSKELVLTGSQNHWEPRNHLPVSQVPRVATHVSLQVSQIAGETPADISAQSVLAGSCCDTRVSLASLFYNARLFMRQHGANPFSGVVS